MQEIISWLSDVQNIYHLIDKGVNLNFKDARFQEISWFQENLKHFNKF